MNNFKQYILCHVCINYTFSYSNYSFCQIYTVISIRLFCLFLLKKAESVSESAEIFMAHSIKFDNNRDCHCLTQCHACQEQPYLHMYATLDSCFVRASTVVIKQYEFKL